MKENIIQKNNLHPRNPHRFQYDFEQLVCGCKELKTFVFINKYNSQTIDFANPEAVKMLNKAILKHFYGIYFWEIPDNYLCPPIPGRADYVHYLADLLASLVYPIIGSQTYNWQFVGSDIDPVAVESARRIIENNDSLLGKIEIRLQTSSTNIFKEIILSDEVFDLTMCNPPFHSSLKEATAGTRRKIKNLGGNPTLKTTLNFGGQNTELWCEGGEESFVKKMILESATIPRKAKWFTSLISKKEHLPFIHRTLKSVKAKEVRTIDMAQGQKVSRIVAWRF
jgi:23S rRNA (adenine1618-N6)-methyltransferase